MKQRVKINKPLKGFAVGSQVVIDSNDPYWKRRLLDAKQDNCIEVVSSNKKDKLTTAVKKDDKEADK